MKYKLNGQWYEIAVPSYDSLPVGAIVSYAGENIPTGYMLCNGQSLLRTEYPDLFNAIGTTYGSDDSTHFNLPNIKGRVLVGLDSTQTEFNSLGKTGGSKYLQRHNHGGKVKVTGTAISSNGQSGGGSNWVVNIDAVTNNASNFYTIDYDGTGDSGNLQPYIVVNYIIKAHPSAVNTSEVVNEHSTSETDVYSANQTNVEIENAIKDVYSTSEVKTNEVWIDGKPIYRKVLSVGSITSTNVINIELPNEVDTLLPNLCGMLYDSAGNGYPINYNNIYNVQVDIGCFYTRTSATSKKISLKQYDNYGIASGYIIVEYTKTTD